MASLEPRGLSAVLTARSGETLDRMGGGFGAHKQKGYALDMVAVHHRHLRHHETIGALQKLSEPGSRGSGLSRALVSFDPVRDAPCSSALDLTLLVG